MLTEDGFFGGSEFGRAFEADLRAALAPEQLAMLSQLCFVLIKPDALLSGKAGEILDRLRASGFEIVFAHLLQAPRESQFEDLYKYNLTLYNVKHQLGAWWLNRQIYGLGPSLSLLVRGGDGTAGDIAARLGRLKGPSSPYNGAPGQIRWDLQATNRSLNLVHSADGPLSTAREFQLFHPPEALKAVLDSMIEGALHTAHSKAGRMVLAFRASRQEFSFLPTLLALKARVAIAGYGDSNEAATARLLDLYSSIGAASSMTEEVRSILRLAEREREVAGALWPADGPLDQLFRLLAAPERYGPALAAALSHRLKACQIHVSGIELLVLQTSIYYFAADALAAEAHSPA
ncbi:MAG TPA: nucleoside-diphosphate kinase [Allosphingosinicella sp.]|jgi:nucleoside diphosphate kinase